MCIWTSGSKNDMEMTTLKRGDGSSLDDCQVIGEEVEIA